MKSIIENRFYTAFLVGLIVAALTLAGVFLYRDMTQAPWGSPGNVQTVQIPRGMGPGQIGRLLEARGVIRSARFFRYYLQLARTTVVLQAGEYRFESPLSLRDVVRQLEEGRVLHHRLTVPEGLDVAETVAHIAAAGWSETASLEKTVARVDLITDLDPAATSLEGFLFPETYFVTRDADGREIIELMVEHFRAAWDQQRRDRAQQLGWTVREVVTMASLIEKEASLPEERALVSSVFHNRLARGVRLACDPTVIYAVKLVKEYDGIIHQSDLELDSPYNTYLYPGLPPGPIANPGLESIDAALNPADSDFLFFVSRNDGSHVFSTNYRDHQRAVRQYQR